MFPPKYPKPWNPTGFPPEEFAAHLGLSGEEWESLAEVSGRKIDGKRLGKKGGRFSLLQA